MKNLKIILSLLLVSAFLNGLNAQEKKNCYIDYLTLFKDRGAKVVTDGVQNIVVTSRNSDGTTCTSMVGTIEVKGGKIAGNLLVKTVSGELIKPNDKLHENYFLTNDPMKADYSITNGMSATFLTQKKDVVNLFFTDFVNPAPPVLQEAPKAK
jgi:hypothetical protein